MQKRLYRFVDEIPKKEHVLQLVKKLDLSLKIETELDTFYLAFKDGSVDVQETFVPAGVLAKISGKEVHFDQLFDGDLKLLQGVKMNYFITDCPFRAQLVLESLFYLARPLPV
jgi:hypothetical protein